MKKSLSRILSVILAVMMIVSITAVMPVASMAEADAVNAEAAGDAVAKVQGDVSVKGVEIADTLYGIFFEDINWAGDAGIYPEKFTNRSFEYFGNDWNSMGSARTRTTDAQAHRHGWLPVGNASFEVVKGDEATYMNKNNTYFAKVNVADANAGILNFGYGNITGKFVNNNEVCYPGMNFKAGDVYYFSMYVYGPVDTDVTVTLYGGGGNSSAGMFTDATYEVGKVTFPVKTTGEGWQQVKTELTVEKDVAVDGAYKQDGFAAITFADAGEYTLDFISLFPQATYNNRENGLRKDLVEMLKGMNPGFMRFPGGCIVEGVGPTNRYNWKNTVGSIEERKLDWNLWNEHTYAGGSSNTYYYQSFGLGFYEYMCLCEDIGAEPMPVFNCGMSCELRHGSLFADSERYAAGTNAAAFDISNLQPFIDDAIDFMDFCLADPAENKWAALRAEMGRPEPFELHYVSIGNEQSNAIFAVYYDAFITQMREKYPDIKYIPSWNQGNTMYNWLINGNANSPGAKTLDYAWAADEHFYVNSEATMYNSYVHRYDNYPRVNADGETRTYVFAGEYSLQTANHQLTPALAEAAMMTGFERNADLVKMASYAPLFAKDGFAQWNPNLIFFSEYMSYGKPSYYTQAMYGNNAGDYYIPHEVSESGQEEFKIAGSVGVGCYSTPSYFDDLKVTDNVTGEVLFSQDFQGEDVIDLASAGLTDYSGRGTWSVDTDAETGNKYLNESRNTSSIFACVNDPAALNWENYTYEVKCMKASGAEGFTVPFCYKGTNDYYWFNVAGWNNTQHAIEHGTSITSRGGALISKAGNINTNQWYTLKMVVNGAKVDCYLDGVLQFSYTATPAAASTPYTSMTFDEDANEVIIKAVNSTAKGMKTQFVLDGVEYVNPTGEMIQLADDQPIKTGTNTLTDPENLIDRHYTFEGFDTTFYYTLPAYSFTIFRISLDNDANKIASAENAVVETTEGVVPELPKQVTVKYEDGHEGLANVTWDAKPDCFYGIAGQYQIEGDIEGTNVKGYIDVTVSDEAPVVSDVVSVNGKTDGSAVVKVNNDIVITFTVEKGAAKIGLLNENGKWLSRKSAVAVDNGNGTETWTVVTSSETKGERSLIIFADFGEGLVDTGLTAPVKVVKEIASPELGTPVITEAKITGDAAQYKKNENITMTIKTNAAAEKVGLFNEMGTGISKSIVSVTDNGDGTMTWNIVFSIGSAGARTITVKAGNGNGWSDGIDTAVKIVK